MKRLITKKFLETYNFKYDVKSRLWYGWFAYPDQYVYEDLKYDFDNKVLYTSDCRTIGLENTCQLDEVQAYKWIKNIGHLLRHI